ncbi:MAG: aspartyl/asparaginyl beta-hydroxylase domain-containing protein [Xanthobacteraceae bacterium]
MYCDPSNFPFVTALTQNWRVVRSEFEALAPQNMIPWPERFLYDQGWDVYGLHAFGSKLTANCERCPGTTRLVEAIPGMTTAGFSILQPGTHIRPHVGYTSAVLRCHLGLVTPPGCTMRVGAEVRTWDEGQCLIFDDTVEHEVWHKGDAARAILLIDFAKPGGAVRAAG